MSLNTFINFEKLLDAELCSVIYEPDKSQSAFTKQNKNVNHYVDNEIKTLVSERTEFYQQFIINASNENDYVKLKDQYLTPVVSKIDKDIDIRTSSFYKSTNYYVCYFVVEDDDNDLIFLGLMHKKTKRYLFIGTAGSHPFIATNDFIYDNSDGSGPCIDEIIGTDFNVYKLITTICSYFVEFTNDVYH